MNTNSLQNRNYNLSRAFAYGMITCLFLALIMSLMLSIISIFYQKVWFEFIGVFIGYSLFWILVTSVINFICLILIGIPTVYILNKINLSNPLYAAVIGALSVYLYICIYSEVSFDWSFMLYIIYGFSCGYAFMYGYLKGGQK